MGIGNKLRELLKEKNMTVIELAEKIHVAPTTIYSIIQRNSKKVDIDILLDMADVLGIDAEYFRNSAKKDETIAGKKIALEKVNDVTVEEYEYIKKYRSLDKYGKKTVDVVLNVEYERIAEKMEIDVDSSASESLDRLSKYKSHFENNVSKNL